MRRSTALAHPAVLHGTPHGAPLPPEAVQQLRHELGALLRRTRTVLRTADPAVDLDLDQPVREVLAHVVTQRRAYPADIASRLGRDEHAVGRAVHELQQLGLLVPITEVSNPATAALVPTAMGRRIHAEGADAATDALHDLLAGWSVTEVETLTRLLARLTRPAA